MKNELSNPSSWAVGLDDSRFFGLSTQAAEWKRYKVEMIPHCEMDAGPS